MSNLRTQMRHRDRDMVPRVLVQAMFTLMIASVALVAYAQWTDRPNVGVLVEAPVVRETVIAMTGGDMGIYTVTDARGQVLALSSDALAGFIGVMGRVIDRKRFVEGVAGNPPLRVVLRDNGHVAIIDDATGMVTELIGYGADNVAAFAQFVN